MSFTPPPTSDPSPDHIDRVEAARQLLRFEQLRHSVTLSTQPSLRISIVAGIQVALSGLLAILLAYFSPWPELVGFTALGAMSALFGRFAPLQMRRRMVAQCGVLMALAVLVPSLAVLAGTPTGAMMLVIALVAGASTLIVSHLMLGAPGAVIIVFAAGASLAPVADMDIVWARTLATLAGGLVAWLCCTATDWLRQHELPRLNLPKPVPPPMRQEIWVALRITLGAGLAAGVAYLSGMHHPSWAAIGATAVMQGAHLHITLSRALQRMVGTVVGAVIAWIILVQDPSFFWIVACIVLFQLITELVMGFNYALGQVTITPMALMMTSLAAPTVVASAMPVERVMDTILGAALGIGLSIAFSTLEERRQLAKERALGQA